MSAAANSAPAVAAHALRKRFEREHEAPVCALDAVSLEAEYGKLTALVGPDGAGKTTLMRLAAGLLRADAGSVTVLGIDVAKDPQQVQDRISYMPQRFGLYEDLSVAENLDLYADLHGVSATERAERYPRLMDMTALGPFKTRLAGQLSGGMKQKLGLACTLVRSPQLLLLDEPTVGVDPLSRRELWEIVTRLVSEQGLTVLLSTAYLDEAERCSRVIMLHQGQVLSQGSPLEVAAMASGRSFVAVPAPGQSARSLQARLLDQPDIVDAVPDGGRVRFVRSDAAQTQTAQALDALHELHVNPVPPRFEDGFMMLLQAHSNPERADSHCRRAPARTARGRGGGAGRAAAEKIRRLHRGRPHPLRSAARPDLRAARPQWSGENHHLSHAVRSARAERGRTARGGRRRARCARLGPRPARLRRTEVLALRPLSVTENLEFFASAYGLRGERKRERIGWAMEQFELGAHARATSAQLPGGYKQRLAMAAALLHEPEILFLDEPTSGADPRARRAFWRRITALADQGVTVIITTHFMQEAEYCDRIAIMDSGRILAQGSPARGTRGGAHCRAAGAEHG